MARARKFPVLARGAAPTPSATAKQASLPFQDVLAQEEPVAHHSRISTAQRLWFCVYLPALALEANSKNKTPCAVVEERQGLHRVMLVNAAAAAAGVLPGQSSSAALALLPELELAERDRLNEQQVLESLAGWLEQFSSFVSLAGKNVLLLEVAGSLRLFGGLKNLRQQVSAGLRQQGYTAALAIAPTPLAAQWLARSGRRACVREPANIVPQLRSLPLSCLDWPDATVQALTDMGIKNIGDCLRLPREGFARRFGAARLLELDRALGRLPDPRCSWRAPEQFCADQDLLEEQSDRQLLLAACAELLQTLEQFLLLRQLGTQRLLFSFYHLRAPATTLSLGGMQAEYSAARWLDLLSIRFERLCLPEAVIAIRLQAGHTQAMQAASGRLAFNGRKQRVERYSMLQLAERLSARMGRHSVLGVTTVADHRPHCAWATRNLLANKVSDALEYVRYGLKRPLWMLPEPALLHAEQGFPVHLGRLRLIEGPERLETGWWDEQGIARDYYTAVNSRGMRLWVFRDRVKRSINNCAPQASWYLHGFFG